MCIAKLKSNMLTLIQMSLQLGQKLHYVLYNFLFNIIVYSELDCIIQYLV